MPTVPRRDGPEVGTNALPTVRVTPVQQTPTLDLSGPAQLAGQIAERERQKADDVAILDADRQLSDTVTGLLYDPEKGALNSRGRNALEAADEARKQWRKRTEEIASNLKTDRQRGSFQHLVVSRSNDLEQAVTRHEAGELRKFDEETANAAISNELTLAVQNYRDAGRVAQAVDYTRAVIIDHARRSGAPEEATQLRLAENVTRVHAAVIARMLANGDDLAANRYYAEHKADVTGATAIELENQLQEGSSRGESQRRSDEILAAPDITRAAALAEARKIADPKLRDTVADRINHRFDEQKRAEEEEQDDLYQHATNLIDRPANRGRLPRDVIPPASWMKLSLAQRNALENRAEAPAANDDGAWLGFLELGPEAVGKMSRASFESGYWAKLDHAHRSRAEAMWTSAREAMKTSRSSPELTAALTFKDRVENTLRETGIADLRGLTPTSSPTKYKAAATVYARFEQEAASRLEHFELTQLQGKRKATGDEIQQILDDLAIKRVHIDRRWPDADVEQLAAFVTKDDVGRAYVPRKSIPAADVATIDNLIRSRGGTSWDSKVERAYAAMMLNLPIERFYEIIDEGGAGRRRDETIAAPRPDTWHGPSTGGGSSWGDSDRTAAPNAGIATPPSGSSPPRTAPAPQLPPAGPSRSEGTASPATPTSRTAVPVGGYTAATVLDAIVAHRDGGVRDLRIPGETEDLEGREAFLRAFLDNRYSLGKHADRLAVVYDARKQLGRIERIKRGELKPSATTTHYIGG